MLLPQYFKLYVFLLERGVEVFLLNINSNLEDFQADFFFRYLILITLQFFLSAIFKTGYFIL